MEKINIKVNKKTGMVYLDTTVLGRDLENLQQELVFTFEDSFPLGSARLEYKLNGEKYHIPMMIVGESYTIPIKNVILSEGKIDMQLVVVQAEQDEEIPVFKSNVFYMYCNKSINAQTEAPDDYEYWLDVIEEKLAEVDEALAEADNLDIDVSKSGTTSTISITRKDGTEKSVEVKDATINGMNSIELVAGENIQIRIVGNQIIISATGVVPPTPTTDVQLLTSDNKIFLTSDNANFIVKESE